MPAKYAAAYLRRSAATTNNPGNASREAQEEAVRRLCGDAVTVYADWGVSGSGAKLKDRPEYARLKEDIASGLVSSVCAYSLTRLGRNARELLDFMELCRTNDVPVRTAVESVDTSSAFGRAMFGIMAVFAQLELEQGVERSNAAREARRSRAEAAEALLPGGRLPTIRALYGFKHIPEVVEGGGTVYRRVHDPENTIGPLIDAYHEAGTINGACHLLAERGIPSPHGTSTWGSSTLRRILKAHRDCPATDHPKIDLPDRNASGKVRRGGGAPALFRGLLRCWCGRTLTPNVQHHAYYCSAGRNQGVDTHGRFTIPERELKRALWPEAARQYRNVDLVVSEAATGELDALLARRDRIVAFGVDGLLPMAQVKAEVAELNARVESIERQATSAKWITGKAINFEDEDVAGQNALLRQLWVRVQLDREYVPHVEWLHDPDAVREAELEAERLADQPDETGESQNSREVTAMWEQDIAARREGKSVPKGISLLAPDGPGLPPMPNRPVGDVPPNPYPARKRNRNAKVASGRSARADQRGT